MDANKFLKELFSISPDKTVLVRSVPAPRKKETAKTHRLDARRPKLPEIDSEHNWYFGVCPRNQNDKVTTAVAVWADLDGAEEMSAVQKKVAPLSAEIGSGHGLHVYWMLNEEVPIADAERLVRLAQMALEADKQAVDPTRLLRIPGSTNVKKQPHEPCKMFEFSGKRYDLKKIEEMLMGALISLHWEEGNRNQMVLGFSTVAARCEWSEARAERVVRAVCKATGDDEIPNRIKVVRSTYERHTNGDVLTFKGFSESLGKYQKELLEILGYNAKDGEVMLGEQVVGEQSTILQDLVRWFLGEDEDNCEWAWSEGQLMRWDGLCWTPRELPSMAAEVFAIMDQLVLLKNGREKKLPAKPRDAEGVARMVKGSLACRSFDEHDPDLVGFSNGIYNLQTGEFFDSHPKFHFKKIMPVEYNPDASCPSWVKFLEEAVPKAQNFLQEWVGYCLRPGNYFQRMLWVYGLQNTGKSTFLVTIFNLFGPTAVTVSSQNISQYQVAGLTGALLAVCTELTTQRFRTGVFKALVSGDPVTARHPYGRPHTVQYTGKLMWGSNALPTVDEAEGLWRRLVIIEFVNIPKRVDVGLINRILSEELSGVLNWAVEGFNRVREYALEGTWAVPMDSVESVMRYREYTDLVDLFLLEEMEVGKGHEVSIREAFTRYSDFCRIMNHPYREFGVWFVEEFRHRGFKIDGKTTIKGIKMKSSSNLSWELRGA